jgi:hypothetical protein
VFYPNELISLSRGNVDYAGESMKKVRRGKNGRGLFAY